MIIVMQKDQELKQTDKNLEIPVRFIAVLLKDLTSFDYQPIHTETIDKI